MRLGFPPIAINMNSVREKPGEVLAIMREYLNNSKQEIR